MFIYPFGLNKLNIHSRSLNMSGTARCLKRLYDFSGNFAVAYFLVPEKRDDIY